MSNGRGKDIEVGKAYFVEDAEGDPCDLCARRTSEPITRHWKLIDGSNGVDYICERCQAVLEVAERLLDNEVEDENEIITTLALAAYAGLSWTDEAKQVPDQFRQEHPGLRFSRNVDGMTLFRMLPLSVEVIRYDGTEIPREIRIKVSSRVVKSEDLARYYEQVLAAERIPSEECPAGSVAWSTEDASLTITIKPGAEIHPVRAQHIATYPRGQIYRFPPISVIQAAYEALLGSFDSRTFRGYAYALGYHGRPQSKWKRTETNIVACLACWFGELDTTARVAERRPRISRALNRHLLSRYNMTQLPESSWTANRNLRRNVKVVGSQFMRASYLWQQSDRWPTVS
jgi:hypothetical protein